MEKSSKVSSRRKASTPTSSTPASDADQHHSHTPEPRRGNSRRNPDQLAGPGDLPKQVSIVVWPGERNQRCYRRRYFGQLISKNMRETFYNNLI